MLSLVLISCSSILPWFSSILIMSGLVGGLATGAGDGDGDAQRLEAGGGGGDGPALFNESAGNTCCDESAGGAGDSAGEGC